MTSCWWATKTRSTIPTTSARWMMKTTAASRTSTRGHSHGVPRSGSDMATRACVAAVSPGAASYVGTTSRARCLAVISACNVRLASAGSTVLVLASSPSTRCPHASPACCARCVPLCSRSACAPTAVHRLVRVCACLCLCVLTSSNATVVAKVQTLAAAGRLRMPRELWHVP